MILIRQLQVTTAAGTAQAAPLTTPFPLTDGVLRRVELVIPRGHAGLTGIRVMLTGSQLIPFDTGAFMVGDGADLAFDIEQEVAGGAISVDTYNTGLLPHSHWLRAHVEPVGTVNVPNLAPGPAFRIPAVTVSNVETG